MSVRKLKSPLPEPVLKPHRRMEFDIQDAEEEDARAQTTSEDDFDITIFDGDDFDI
ncbi:MAG: hypothetical protein PUF49_03180 [Firmicutes bacterium]|nr:hypothetical protein [Bacillota bacterium]